MKKLTFDEKLEIRKAIDADNKRIEYQRLYGNQKMAVDSKRAKNLTATALATKYKVTPAQIRTAARGLL